MYSSIGEPRKYPPLPDAIVRGLSSVAPVRFGELLQYPCQVTLHDGSIHDHVYLCDASEWIKIWGVWPDQDRGKREITIDQVVAVAGSPSRLPPDIANTIYQAGESGMGYSIFTLVFRDGSRQAYGSGNAVDFIEYPTGLKATDIVDVIPHEGRENRSRKTPPEYYWCLFGS
jgi:hypothetical protein